MLQLAIIGGGASAFFLGANLKDPKIAVTIFEKAATPLQKVRISGGGRCNVTHACFDPRELTEFYPRGNRELRSVFSRFQPGDTMGWFEERGVPLKIQEDNRVFPVSDNSGDIVSCLIKENQQNKTEIRLKETVKKIIPQKNGFELISNKSQYQFDKVVVASGSSPQIWKMISKLGHNIIQPVPSLFTFKCKDHRITDLQGISFPNAQLSIKKPKLENQGSLLITHWGFSGPATLVLSAWGARKLAEVDYQFHLKINFIDENSETAFDILKQHKNEFATVLVRKKPPFGLTKRFWEKQISPYQISEKKWADVPDKILRKISESLTASIFEIKGKSTFKDEFVTAGGVDLKEIDFKTMESRKIPGLYFAGEVLNIDAVTGGFNFQACWSEAFVIAESLLNNNHSKSS